MNRGRDQGVGIIMKRILCSSIAMLTLSAVISACGGGGGGGGFSPPPPPPPPPPPAAQSPAGIWTGQAVTPDIADLFTGFETVGAGDFTVGTAPFTAVFAGGLADTRANPALYRDGIRSWHITGAATITLATPASTLSFWTRTVPTGGTATIVVRDTAGAMIDTIVPPDTPITEFAVDSAGGLPIGSVDVNVTAGEIVIDVVTFVYPSTASTDAVACLIDPNNTFVCIVSDATTGNLVSGANGTVAVAVDQVSGTGWLYAAPGGSFADGSTIATLTISAGTVAENTSLDLTFDGTGVSIAVTTTFDASFNRPSDLTIMEAAWMNFDIFGDASSFDVDDMGAISGTSANTCMLLGQVSADNPTVNVYDVAITVTNGGTCGIPAGDYNGLGRTQEVNVADDHFHFSVFIDGISMIVGDVDRP